MSKKMMLWVIAVALAGLAIEIAVVFFRHHTSVGGPTASIPAKKWEFSTGAGIIGTPALGDDGTLYVGSLDGYLYALDPSGNLTWKFYTSVTETSPVVASDGTIYIANRQGRVYALNRNGTQRWAIEASAGRPNYGRTGSAADDNWLYTYCYHSLCSLSLNDGSERWEMPLAYMQYGAPVILPLGGIASVGHGRVNVISPDGTLQFQFPVLSQEAIDKNSGFPPPGTGAFDTPFAVGSTGTIYVGTGNAKLAAIAPDGSLQWEFHTAQGNRGGPVIAADGTIYFLSEDLRLYALNPDGARKWELLDAIGFNTTPALAADGTIFVAGSTNLLAVSPEGRKKWEFSTGGGTDVSPTIAPDGTVYFCTAAGKVIAIQGADGGLMNSPWPKYQRDARNSGRTATVF